MVTKTCWFFRKIDRIEIPHRMLIAKNGYKLLWKHKIISLVALWTILADVDIIWCSTLLCESLRIMNPREGLIFLFTLIIFLFLLISQQDTDCASSRQSKWVSFLFILSISSTSLHFLFLRFWKRKSSIRCQWKKKNCLFNKWFHVAVFNNRSQMTSTKCSKNERWHTRR